MGHFGKEAMVAYLVVRQRVRSGLVTVISSAVLILILQDTRRNGRGILTPGCDRSVMLLLYVGYRGLVKVAYRKSSLEEARWID